jgi:ABC-type multidrug transport system fused ATPase/permease subunit
LFRILQPSIRFEYVTFAYDKEPVISNLNIVIPVGRVVALVGTSGAGKSTSASLIPRCYDLTVGAIALDGIDLRKFTKKDLREHIAVVPEMPSPFSALIEENFRIVADGSHEQLRTRNATYRTMVGAHFDAAETKQMPQRTRDRPRCFSRRVCGLTLRTMFNLPKFHELPSADML